MKVINPFNRREKKNFIPLSLFPASKVVRTSTQLGVATPVYCNEMIQGNKIKLTLSEFTRFASLSKPVMNNFQVEFGAYFVPFHSLDVFTKNAPAYSQGQPRPRLDARKFFNPSTPDNERVKFGNFIANRDLNPNGDVINGLFAHLGYPIYYKPLDASKIIWPSGVQVNDTLTSMGYINSLYAGISPESALFGAVSDTELEFKDMRYSSEPQLSLPTFTEYLAIFYPHIVGGIKNIGNNLFEFTPIQLERLLSFCNSGLKRWASGELTSAEQQAYGITFPEAISGYVKYCHNSLCLLENNIRVPFARWLAYNRIYGDWFLNELYTDRDKFFEAIGKYYSYIGHPDPDDIPAPTFIDGFGDPVLSTWLPYIQGNKCYPVLWSKDRFTSAQVEETTSSTPIGSTITENFFNRMYARFKDLIARMGSDYKTNTSALYGHTISDDTLQRSQLVGYKSFNITIGDIAQTSASDENGRLGQFAGFAISAKDKNSFGEFEWTADENGLFMVLMWVRPMYTSIIGAVDRQIFHNDYFDYLLPQFGGVGYQDISNAELGIKPRDPNGKFLIQERYSEYMSCLNECSADMVTVLSDYHVDRYLPGNMKPPIKNNNVDFLYMTSKDNLSRIFAAGDSVDPVFCTLNFEGTITRQLPATIQTEF